jgi:hypothetical protein
MTPIPEHDPCVSRHGLREPDTEKGKEVEETCLNRHSKSTVDKSDHSPCRPDAEGSDSMNKG